MSAQHRPRRRFGQNFLHDDNILRRLVSTINPQSGESILEIGPGKGALTRHLLQCPADLTAVELDRDLVALLRSQFGDCGIRLLDGDALQIELATLVPGIQRWRIVGNLPYNISTPLLFHLLESPELIVDMHFLLQREVVQRLAAEPGTKAFGRLSVMTQYLCEVEPLFEVTPQAFYPPPKVTSQFVRLAPRKLAESERVDTAVLHQVLRTAFSQRRKTLRRALQPLFDAAQLSQLNIDSGRRPDTLNVAEYLQLARAQQFEQLMAHYAIGDVQGCYQPLRCLLEQVEFNPGQDQLLFTGDLVNRGPESLAVLRFVHALGDAAVCVLGNHDLHLLAIDRGVRGPHPKDTLEEILDAPDREELLNWLRHCPLLHRHGEWLMVHAGFAPQWDLDQIQSLAAEVEAVLRGPDVRSYFVAMYGNEPACWDDSLTGPTRWRVITNYMTRMRVCTADGRLDLSYKGDENNVPANTRPWYAHPHRRSRNVRILFGHWAALQGVTGTDQVVALDTGCVWGGQLRMMRLEDEQMFHCDCPDQDRFS